MKKVAPIIIVLLVISNLWLGIQTLRLVIGTISDYFRYSGNIDWTGDLAFFGKIVVEALLLNVLGPMLIGVVSSL